MQFQFTRCEAEETVDNAGFLRRSDAVEPPALEELNKVLIAKGGMRNKESVRGNVVVDG